MKKNINSDYPVLFKIVMLFAGLLAGFVVIKIFFLLMVVKSESMNPTLKAGDTVIINKVSSIKKGDMVALNSPSDDGGIIISRVIASEYETVEIRNKVVFVNDRMLAAASDTNKNEKIIYPMKFCYRDNMPPVRIDRNEFFVLGDNFDRGFDSRSFGKISKSSVIGKIVYKK